MLVWAVFDDISEFEENPAAVYAAPFIMDDGEVLARVNSADWSGETLSDEAAIALINSQPEAPMKPPPQPPPGPPEGGSPEPEPEPEPDPEPEPEPEPDPLVIEYDTWLKSELKTAALDLGIPIPSSYTKAKIIEKLQAHPDQEAVLDALDAM